MMVSSDCLRLTRSFLLTTDIRLRTKPTARSTARTHTKHGMSRRIRNLGRQNAADACTHTNDEHEDGAWESGPCMEGGVRRIICTSMASSFGSPSSSPSRDENTEDDEWNVALSSSCTRAHHTAKRIWLITGPSHKLVFTTQRQGDRRIAHAPLTRYNRDYEKNTNHFFAALLQILRESVLPHRCLAVSRHYATVMDAHPAHTRTTKENSEEKF